VTSIRVEIRLLVACKLVIMIDNQHVSYFSIENLSFGKKKKLEQVSVFLRDNVEDQNS